MLVVQPHKNHRRLVVRAIEEARSMGLNLIGVIINRLAADGQQSYYSDGYGYGYGYGAGYDEQAMPETESVEEDPNSHSAPNVSDEEIHNDADETESPIIRLQDARAALRRAA